jgi:hypothetical protein
MPCQFGLTVLQASGWLHFEGVLGPVRSQDMQGRALELHLKKGFWSQEKKKRSCSSKFAHMKFVRSDPILGGIALSAPPGQPFKVARAPQVVGLVYSDVFNIIAPPLIVRRRVSPDAGPAA